MGGRTTYAGGKIKQGLIYRTSGSKFDNSTPSDAEARRILTEQLRVKTEQKLTLLTKLTTTLI